MGEPSAAYAAREPGNQEIVRAAGRSKAGEWVVVSISDDEKKRQPTLRGRIQAAAVQAGVQGEV